MDLSLGNNNIIEGRNIELAKEQNNFLESNIGKIINTGINLGIKYLLPDFIEDEVINIKDSIFNNGLKEGIDTAIKSTIDIGKSTLGIVTGKFENINQIKKVVEKGGIIDALSKTIDYTLNNVEKKGLLNNKIINTIKSGKNVILDNISSNIEEMLINQIKEIENIDKYTNNWKEAYIEKNFNSMQKEINKINKSIEKIIPLENIIKEARQVQNIHNTIKNNGLKFDLDNVQVEAAKILV